MDGIFGGEYFRNLIKFSSLFPDKGFEKCVFTWEKFLGHIFWSDLFWASQNDFSEILYLRSVSRSLGDRRWWFYSITCCCVWSCWIERYTDISVKEFYSRQEIFQSWINIHKVFQVTDKNTNFVFFYGSDYQW